MITTIIGIDPGVNAGLAILDIEKKHLIIKPSKFWKIIDFSDTLKPDEVIFVVENANQYSGIKKKAYQYKKYQSQVNSGKANPTGFMSTGESDHITQSVGMVKRECQLYIERFQKKGFRVFEYYPRHAKLKKIHIDAFCQKEGFTVETLTVQQHGIDAATCVFMTLPDIKQAIGAKK